MSTTIIEIPVEELDAASFSPFGAVIGSGRPAEAFSGRPNRMIDLQFTADGTPALYLIRYLAGEMTVSKFERHLTLTEARLALGAAAVLAVAGPTPFEAFERLPETESVRAFLIRRGTGLVLKRGAWHALNCFPVGEQFADFAFLSERESEQELIGPNPRLERTQMIDFADSDKAFRVVDRNGLLDRH